jgi:peptidoglycan hydrolase CwlO-like protein
MFRQGLVCLLVVFVVGCGARTEVAKDKLLAQVDALLGEVDVKHKAVEIKIRDFGEGIDRLKKGKIDARVRVANVDEQITAIDQKIADADKTLGRLRDYLKDGKDIELSGTTFTSAQLKDMADKTISARKSLGTQVDALRKSKDRLDNVATNLESREREASEKISTLKRQLDEIDAKAVALKSIKEASQLSGNDAGSDFPAVEKDIRELSTKIDAELAYHDEKLKGTIADDDKSALDAVIKQTSTAGDTLSEIDKVLGKQ